MTDATPSAWPWSARRERRSFLRGLVLATGAIALGRRPAWAATAGGGLRPEYAGRLDEILVVYDQVSSPHLLREIVAIARHAPPGLRLNVLVSRGRLEEARQRLDAFGLENLHFVASEEEGVSGDWARDIFQLSYDADQTRVLHVPWNKGAATREELDRGVRQLRRMRRPDLRVRALPVAAEGGNLVADRQAGRAVLYAGSTIALETRALYRHFYGQDPGEEGVASILAEGLGADEVVWVGPRSDRGLQRQGRFVFHVDMLMTLVSPTDAVVARCDPGALDPNEHLRQLRAEARRTLEALDRRERAGLAAPEEGLDLPRDPEARESFLRERLRFERAEIEAAASQMEAAARALRERGRTVHRVEADPRRVRRFQSPTNVVVSRGRLLVPIYPTLERVHGWIVHGDRGRDVVDVDLGLRDSEFALEGDNLARVRLYRSLHEEVRVVRDYFYLASGNVHCVIGRMG